MLSYYRELLSIRKTHQALQSGDYQTIPDSPPGCYLYLRENRQERILVALNLKDDESMIKLSYGRNGKFLLSTYGDQKDSIPESYNLRPHEGVIILL